jgi:hypothetical protein
MINPSNNYRSPAKTDSRQLNAITVERIASRCPKQTLLSRSGKLRGRFLDLGGPSTKEVLGAYQRLLERPSQLILVESDWSNWLKGRLDVDDLEEAERPLVIHHDAYELAYSINHGSNKKDAGELIGVFSFDLTNLAGLSWWMTRGFQIIKHAIMPAINEYKACVLILNHSLDGDRTGHEGATTKIEAHVDGLRRVLFQFKGAEQPRGLFLPSKEEVRDVIFNFDFKGNSTWVNKLHLYRSSKIRMATLRLYLQSGNFHICSESDLAP